MILTLNVVTFSFSSLFNVLLCFSFSFYKCMQFNRRMGDGVGALEGGSGGQL